MSAIDAGLADVDGGLQVTHCFTSQSSLTMYRFGELRTRKADKPSLLTIHKLHVPVTVAAYANDVSNCSTSYQLWWLSVLDSVFARQAHVYSFTIPVSLCTRHKHEL